ncbi:DUF1028 domain-containing protein [Radiobacillus kanasensis]|uniref:DUF1028 domain-containing protein n=1 Tax=Radiobacillus kanasensis TaxID=2844358 RepID=UPI001E6461FD|nr:DUF1028 domain-containing protein [Radiobacillus kanasensis]UFU00844.1 DUF1028 domain-containing protein [Radiobacillus kanasensis]
MKKKKEIVATYSIVGFDPETGELGVAVQSKFIGVGSVVPWAKAGVGAVATQAFANPAYGPDGLKLMEEGKTPAEAIEILTSTDKDKEERQVGMVDAKGNAATFTGSNCYDWAGGVSGENFAAQGNILVNKETVTDMAEAFQKTKGSLAERLLSGLSAAQNAGGDSRGKQSSAIYIVKEKGGYGGLNDVFIDLRVDDHPEPIKELIRLYNLQQLYFGETKEENIQSVEGEVRERLVQGLVKWGYLNSMDVEDTELFDVFTRFLHTENFEERELEQGKLDLEVLQFIESK